MQLTENDTTQDMPAQLPDDFFIPDADYDAATGDTGGKAHDISQPTPSTGTNTNAPASGSTTYVGIVARFFNRSSSYHNRTAPAGVDHSGECRCAQTKTSRLDPSQLA